MSRDYRSYTEGIEASESTHGDVTRFAPLEVRVIESESRRPRRRSSYKYIVVDHATEEVIYEGRSARPYAKNPSSGEEAARARGFASGYLAAHPEYGGH